MGFLQGVASMTRTLCLSVSSRRRQIWSITRRAAANFHEFRAPVEMPTSDVTGVEVELGRQYIEYLIRYRFAAMSDWLSE